ncbi:MAG: hypothetical protein O3A93_03055 [Chloroflexi bacterium]|nr:hypothetical protein [Chloroflexota bacterium]MDA1270229.1 hypothetical protein [Chloroflexota bacterium]PKB59617.1 MAG: hypothetical protein BZY83_00985 [SAR202 cluster bacterium Casp-Chloro-G2]
MATDISTGIYQPVSSINRATASQIKRLTTALSIAVLLLVAVACTSGDSGADPVTEPTTAPATQSPADTPADATAPNIPDTAEPESGPGPLTNNGGTSGARASETPAPEPDIVPTDTVALVLAVSGGSSSGTLKTIVNDSSTGAMLGTKFIQLESSSRSVLLYIPDTGETTVLNSYSSPSYAPHFKRPYTLEDRLYVSDKYTNGGAMTIAEYDTRTLDRKSEWGTQSDVVDPGYAVAGGRVYFKTGSTQQWSMSRGYYNVPGDYIRSPYDNGGSSTQLDKPDIGFDLVSSGDTLYGAKLPSQPDPVTGVFTVDPETGQPAGVYTAAFEIDGWDDYHPASWQNVVIADGMAYWAGFLEKSGAYSVEILAADLTNPELFTVHAFDMPSTAVGISGWNATIDADNGYVLIKPFYEGGDRSKVFVYNTASATGELIDTGFDITDAQLIFIEG